LNLSRNMKDLQVIIGGTPFVARLETARSPQTTAMLQSLLPFRQKLVHARWSGEACWAPLGAMNFGVGFENPTSFPAPGEMLLYPGGMSETELLLAYGPTRFASKAGQLAGNHIITIVRDLDRLAEVGRRILWQGAEDLAILAG
jgi:hypothetical protein